MQLRNQFDIETRYGLRTFELYEGDITVLSEDVDVLALSAFSGWYTPSPGTVIGALLTNLNLNIQDMAKECVYDLRKAFSIWISPPLHGFRFTRILCVEIKESGFHLADVLENLFVGIAALEAKRIEICSVALPLLGAGLQKQDPRQVMHLLLPKAQQALERSHHLTRILFVERNPEHVAILHDTMNELLKRPQIDLPPDQGTPETLKHSVDFRTVSLRDQTFSLTSQQAEVVQLMYEQHQCGVSELSQHYILTKINSTSKRLRDIFKSRKTAWGPLITQGSGKGMYRLNIFD